MDTKVWTDDEVITNVKQLLTLVSREDMRKLAKIRRPQYIGILNQKFPEFHMGYPALFNLIVDEPDKFEMNRLLNMLKIRSRVSNGEITYDTASEKIGQEYYNEYVKPHVNELDRKRLEDQSH